MHHYRRLVDALVAKEGDVRSSGLGMHNNRINGCGSASVLTGNGQCIVIGACLRGCECDIGCGE